MTDHNKATPHEELSTPRTDAASRRYDIDGLTTAEQVELCHADFARQLERENADLQAKLEAERRAKQEWQVSYSKAQNALIAAEQALAKCFEATRERCAKVCSDMYDSYKEPTQWDYGAQDGTFNCAKAIRALTQEPAASTGYENVPMGPVGATYPTWPSTAHDEAMRMEGIEAAADICYDRKERHLLSDGPDNERTLEAQECGDAIRAEIVRRTSAQNKDHG